MKLLELYFVHMTSPDDNLATFAFTKAKPLLPSS